jgi:hypothetical protein
MRLLLILIFLTNFLNAQIIKKQIGKSVWVKNNIIFHDSLVSYIIDYDSVGRKSKEWQIYLDTNGNILDTNIAIVDTNNNNIEFQSNSGYTKYEYDSYNNQTRVEYKTDSYRIIYKYINKYDTDFKLVSKETINLTNGIEEYNVDNPIILYSKDTIIEKTGDYLVCKKLYNKSRQLIYQYDSTMVDIDSAFTSTYSYERNNLGQVTKFKKFENGVLVKETFHNYADNIETSQKEIFYLDNYYIVTRFKYEYY